MTCHNSELLIRYIYLNLSHWLIVLVENRILWFIWTKRYMEYRIVIDMFYIHTFIFMIMLICEYIEHWCCCSKGYPSGLIYQIIIQIFVICLYFMRLYWIPVCTTTLVVLCPCLQMMLCSFSTREDLLQYQTMMLPVTTRVIQTI